MTFTNKQALFSFSHLKTHMVIADRKEIDGSDCENRRSR